MSKTVILPRITEPKSLENFLAKIGRRSMSSQITYASLLKYFAKFLKVQHPDDTIQIILKEDPYDLLDSFISWLMKERYSNTIIFVSLATVKKWLRYNGIQVSNEVFKEKVEIPPIEEAFDEAPTKEELRKILYTMEFETQNKMLLLACTGIRVSDLTRIKWTDFKWDEHPVRLIVRDPVKTRRAWETFITDELTERLKAQRQRQVDQEDIFPGATRKAVQCCFIRATEKTGLKELTKPSNRNPVGHRYRIHAYSLKKFFFSQAVAEVGDQMAQAWCGRKAYL